MQQTKAHIQQFIEAGQLELAYQLLLSLDQSEPTQAFMDIVGRSLPDNQQLHRIYQGIPHLNQSNILYEWGNRFRVIADYNYLWNNAQKRGDCERLVVKLQRICANSETVYHTYSEFRINYPDGTEPLLQQIYEMIELNVQDILTHSA
ncbi:hypothetical protein BKI52_22630 [marine bacterium AO1-C]|nr:hypothetical protein BKI52_22630 [marine bacterium AO1-C]